MSKLSNWIAIIAVVLSAYSIYLSNSLYAKEQYTKNLESKMFLAITSAISLKTLTEDELLTKVKSENSNTDLANEDFIRKSILVLLEKQIIVFTHDKGDEKAKIQLSTYVRAER